MQRLIRLVYALRLRRTYRPADRLHCLKRLHQGKKSVHGECYSSDRDIAEYKEGEVLIMSTFRNRSILPGATEGNKVPFRNEEGVARISGIRRMAA